MKQLQALMFVTTAGLGAAVALLVLASELPPVHAQVLVEVARAGWRAVRPSPPAATIRRC